MQGHIGRNTLIIRDCHSPLSVQDRSSGEKNKEIEDLNNKVNRDLTDVCQTLHPDNRDYIFYSSTHSTFKHTYIHTHTHEEGKNWSHIRSQRKHFCKVKIFKTTLYDHDTLKLEFTNTTITNNKRRKVLLSEIEEILIKQPLGERKCN